MTWSIVARDPATGHLGVAVASRFFAVGGIVPYIRGSIGAVATQAFVNPLYGVDGLVALAAGKAPQAIVAELTARDEGRDQRQMHLIDANGRNAAFTGARCIDWAGHLVEENISVAGNMLAGPEVVAETLATYRKAEAKPLVERLLEAMQAGGQQTFKLEPDAVTKKLIHAVESSRPRRHYYVTTPTYLAAAMRRLLPNFAIDYFARRF